MSEHITHTAAVRRLERTSDRMVAGVSGGLGRYFDLNPAFFRLGFVVLTLLGGAGVLIYLAAVLVIPDEGKEKSIAETALAERRERPWPLAGLVLAGLAIVILLSHGSAWPSADAGGWVLVLIIGLVVVWASRGKRRFGGLIAVLAALSALVLATIIAAVVLSFAWFKVSLSDGIGDRVYTPASAAALHPSYKLGIGKLNVDLSNIRTVTQPTTVKADVGIGKLRIVVPQGVAVAVDAHARAGDVYVFNRHDDGRNADIKTGSGLLVIDATVGAGRIDVERAAG